MRKNEWRRQKDTKLVSYAWTLQYNSDDIWTCHNDGKNQIFDRDLKLLRTLSDQQWSTVFDVTELPNRDVVLAGLDGLYHLTATGETKTVIDKANNTIVLSF